MALALIWKIYYMPNGLFFSNFANTQQNWTKFSGMLVEDEEMIREKII